MDVAALKTTLKCLMLAWGYEWAQYRNLAIECQEIEDNHLLFKSVVSYLWVLDSGCDISSEKLCEINSFALKHPCTCSTSTCVQSCPTFTITDSSPVLSCTGFDIEEVIDDP